MPSNVRKSLERKLIATLAFATLLFSVIAGGADYLNTFKNELKRSHATFENLAATVHSSASIAAFVGNQAIAEDVVSGLLKNAEILAVRIDGNRGFSHSERKPDVEAMWETKATIVYPLLSPTNPADQIGHLRILTNTTLLTARAKDAALNQLFFLVTHTLLLVAILAIAYRRLVGLPLLHLTEHLTRIEPGSNERIPIKRSDEANEIGLVASSVNRYLEISEHAILLERELLDRVTRLESHYRRIFESAKVGVMVLDMNGVLINCNFAVSSRAGRGVPAEPTPHAADYLNQIFCQPKKAWGLIEQSLSSGNVASGDLELLNGDDEPRWAHCLFSIGNFPEDNQHYIEVVFYDVTSRRLREEKALRSAERDGLTDLVNRSGTIAYLERSLNDARINGQGLTVFFMDLDGFKQINDTYGHAAGDTVLLEVARRLRQLRKRSSDLLGRLGGDEFVMMAYGIHKTDDKAHKLAQAMVETLRQPIPLGQGAQGQIGVSIGIASYPDNANAVIDLLEAADEAMYLAKKQGKNGYQVAPSKA